MLRKDETAAGQTYKHARVVKVHVGIDGRVRSADIKYRLPWGDAVSHNHTTHSQIGVDHTRGRTNRRKQRRSSRNHRAKEART